MAGRVIKDSIYTSPNMNDLSVYAERHFYRVLMLADDYGCFESTPAVVRGRCYPLQESIRRTDIEKWQEELREKQILATWTENGHEYSMFVSFEKHNSKYLVNDEGKPTHRRRTTPEPPEELLHNFAQPCTTLPELLNHNHNLNHNQNQNQKPEAPAGALAEVFSLPEWIPGETWDAFLEVRKKKKAPNTSHALGLIVKDLEKIRDTGFNPLDSLNESIKRGWTGVFEPKSNKPRMSLEYPQPNHITGRTEGYSTEDYRAGLG